MDNKENKTTEIDSQLIQKSPTANEKKGGLTQEGEKIASRIRTHFEERQKRFQAMTFPCPVDEKLSNYSGMTGAYQIVVPVFQCPDGHIFSVRSDNQGKATKLLPGKEM